jgi:hypothetical protein
MKAKESLEIKERSIKEWMDVFSELYSQADSERTPEQMWIAVMAHTSSIGESIRKVAFESLLNYAAHTFCWLCSFVNKCNALENDIFSIDETLCGIVSLKYPLVCGHCKRKPCDCDAEKMEKEADKSASYAKLLDLRESILESFEGYSIDTGRKVFYEIYGGRVQIQTLENIGFHFLEEIGEAAVCVRQLSQLRRITENNSTGIDLDFLKQLLTVKGIVENYARYKKKDIDYASTEPDMLRARVVGAKMGLVVEIGDSFSWFCAILNKLDSISRSIYDRPEEHPDILRPLEQILNDVYIDSDGKAKCPSCKSNPCRCAFYNVAAGN